MSLDLHDSPFAGRSLIEASAGTGKTWTLTALYARLLLEQQLSVGQILVVTYTTAATAELRERIRARLAELLALYEGGTSGDDFLIELHRRHPGEAARRRLLLAVHGFDEAAIFTIHGFCQRALQDSAFEAGGDFDAELTQDDREVLDALLGDVWRHVLAEADPAWARFLAKQRITPATLRQALRSHLGKPYLRVEPREAASDAELSAASTAWQRAAALWHDAGCGWIETLRGHGGLSQTTHKVAKLPLWSAELDAYFADPAALFEAPEGLLKLGAVALGKACKKGFDAPQCELADALDTLSQALAAAEPAGRQKLIALQVELLDRLNVELPQRKAAQRLLAFDDLLNRLDEALQGPAGEDLATRLREQYPLALIDEFQDTDPIQYAIFDRIYRDGGDLCFVGDPKQAIYAFRGADLATYLQARDAAERQYDLPFNFRSTPELIAALNRLFDRPQPFAEEGLVYPPVSVGKKSRATLVLPEQEGSAPLGLVWLGDEGLNKARAGELAALDTARRIASLLAASAQGAAYFEEQIEPSESVQSVASPVRASQARSDGRDSTDSTASSERGPGAAIAGRSSFKRTPLKGGDIAVLVSNHREAASVAAELAARGVPSVRRGRDSVWHSEEAAELAAVLAAYAEPGREGVLRYALATRLLGRDAAQIARCQDDERAWDAERAAAEQYHQLWQQQGFMRVFRAWLDQEQVAERLLQDIDGERRLTNLLHLGELLQAESLQRSGLEPLLAWFQAQRGSEGAGEDALLRLESDAERVQIVTIHTSKGLEYPLVFCPFLWDGRLLGQHTDTARCHDEHGQPLLDLGSARLDERLQAARRESFAEKLRLTYVALTRARDRLWLHWGPAALPKVKKDGSLPDEGLHSSALAWLLHGRELSGTDALGELAQHLATREGPALAAELDALAQGSDNLIARLPLLMDEASAAGESRAEPPQALQGFARSLHSAWRIGSFSGLAAGMHMEAPDRDSLAMPAASEPGAGFFAFPRGARAGTCLHAILEDWMRGKGSLEQLVPAALQNHGIDAATWAETATAQLQRVLDCDLDGQGLSLAALDPTRRLPELGFTFPVENLQVEPLRALLADPVYRLPPAMRQATERLQFDELQGFLKGFIDLTFEHDGRWYILDYKSNWLGPTVDHYGSERLEQAIASEHYHLQYLIYLVALRRFLRTRLAGFTDAQLGGAFYLFLRGMPEAGVYFARPDDALLDALDRLFAEAQR
ncbi:MULTISPECIES: UvrD-helicase domain-containing protein [unclassified Pseudomonas]|uniref:UvrD-helicase domain-containing protein n=1 Tax=unclassified Pseudomonas TaxID=196821 RepID=UPI00244917E0|nr:MULTISPECIES: UvrD-helicase domain-containing protein [unclassified Pseudomonas]MDG9925195.1 UvrD-helicase domain-containing protein [Pseudomonas sp. GD04045]MDH0035325.1 UvrD-helicase domain-containing protein [Pseudomonas sp. GD04019]